ncbi:MAG: hypothetical protein FWE53_02480 [Firmicutes bacterium]|nr:hypothetical protein [Bacillota bacterium]
MSKFNLEKNGYSTSEVDNFLFKLKLENDEKLKMQQAIIHELKQELVEVKCSLDKFEGKESQISFALVSAVEKARQIEESARNLYGLEIKRVRILYQKWETLLEKLTGRYGKCMITDEVAALIDEFQIAIAQTLTAGQGGQSHAKMLLSKMGSTPSYSQTKLTAENRLVCKIPLPQQQLAEQSVKDQFADEAKRLAKISMTITPSGPSPADEFLTTEQNTLPRAFGQTPKHNAFFEAIIPIQMKDYINEQKGFDLKEAINPTESLEDIMKAFDFYEEKLKNG